VTAYWWIRSAHPRLSPSGPNVPKVLDFPVYDVSAGYVIVPVAVKRNFAPPRTSMFVSTHTLVAATSMSYDLMLLDFAVATCARAAFGQTITTAPKTSAATHVAVLQFTIFTACPCFGSPQRSTKFMSR
jgi:hypothetical protein